MKGRHLSLPPAAAGLSARLLVLTIAFVMLAEILIYAPSIARFRMVYLEERLADAHLAILALEATPDQMVGEELELELLSHVGAKMVALKKPGAGKLMLLAEPPARAAPAVERCPRRERVISHPGPDRHEAGRPVRPRGA